MSRLWVTAVLSLVSSCVAAYPRSVPGLFSAEETVRIEALFEDATPEVDVREDVKVSRTNRWLSGAALASGRFDWVATKILAADDSWDGANPFDPGGWLRSRVEFVLLHEFKAGDYFSWHVDATPNDVLGEHGHGDTRFLNVNVLLRDPSDFDGGALQVGATNVSLGRGDLHVYRASTPHRVHPITRGVRRTLVVATTEAPGGRERYWASARAGNG